MSELNSLKERLLACDLIVTTSVAETRVYCRFYFNGLYRDRMYIEEPRLLSILLPLIGEGESIDAAGVALLKRELLADSLV